MADNCFIMTPDDPKNGKNDLTMANFRGKS